MIDGVFISDKCLHPLLATIQGHGDSVNGTAENGFLLPLKGVFTQPILKTQDIGAIGISKAPGVRMKALGLPIQTSLGRGRKRNLSRISVIKIQVEMRLDGCHQHYFSSFGHRLGFLQ